MQTREWLLTAAVILIPLCIAVAVTLWSLEQARYRPKKRWRAPAESNAAPGGPASGGTGTAEGRNERTRG